MKIRIYDLQDGVTKLGPGTRYTVWVQGCPRKCPGCMSQSSQDINGGTEYEISDIASWIIKSGREGITISGGEPFAQARELNYLIDEITKVRPIGVIVYTGYMYKELCSMDSEDVKELLAKIDLLIDGPYVDSLNDGKSLRGSSNQNVIALTDRYKAYLDEYGADDASVEFFFKEDKITMVGVPTKEFLEKFKNLL